VRFLWKLILVQLFARDRVNANFVPQLGKFKNSNDFPNLACPRQEDGENESGRVV